MESTQFLLSILTITLISVAYSQSIIQIYPKPSNLFTNRKIRQDDSLYCDSWRFSIETNDAGIWTNIPAICESFVQDYMIGDKYLSDSEIVAGYSLGFAETIEMNGDGKDAWIFDVDETLLSNLPYYEMIGFGWTFNETSFDEWVDAAEAPALPASLNLYKGLKKLGFTIFLLTGRSEYQRNATEKNLLFADYSNWERLILREVSDHGKPASIYKSERRLELVNEGYRIHGNSGDQWSDLNGFAIAERSFKLPNPMYYIA